MISNTQAIILRVIDYQESSKIITALTAEHGKIALIAKGAKKPKSKLAGVLEAGNLLEVVYYYKASRNVQTLTEATSIYSTDIFRKDFERAAILYASLEIISQLLHENEVNYPMFEFTKIFIQWLGKANEVHPSVFAYVQLRLAEINGIGLRLNIDDKSKISYLNISGGSVSDSAEEDLSYKLTPIQTEFITEALSGKKKSIFSAGLENGELKQLVHHIDVYFKYHIDGYQERRSDAIFEQML